MTSSQLERVLDGALDEDLGRPHGLERSVALGEAGCDGGRENAPAAVGVLRVDAAAGQLDQVPAIPVDVDGFCFGRVRWGLLGMTALDDRRSWPEGDEVARR